MKALKGGKEEEGWLLFGKRGSGEVTLFCFFVSFLFYKNRRNKSNLDSKLAPDSPCESFSSFCKNPFLIRKVFFWDMLVCHASLMKNGFLLC